MTTTRAWSVTRPMMSAARCLGEGSLEGGPAGDGEEPIEVLRGVRDEVDVERRDALLEHAPHRPPKAQTTPKNLNPANPSRPTGPPEGPKEPPVLTGPSPGVNRKFA